MNTAVVIVLGLLSASASAGPMAKVSPRTAKPGDPVLVTVTGAKEQPTGNVGDVTLHFFRSRHGYEAVFALPLDGKDKDVSVEVGGVKDAIKVPIKDFTFPETNVIVEDELANPQKEDRDRIDADNKAIIDSFVKDRGEPQFTRSFQRPPGKVTSIFGEWRSFNDGHKGQHLGLDLGAAEGSKLKAVNAGTVVLVRDCFLAGNVVVISHGGGIASAYFHLSTTAVAEGDVVKQGAVIGLAGHTGRTTGPHLHISMRVPGGFVDPAAFFRLALVPLPTVHGVTK